MVTVRLAIPRDTFSTFEDTKAHIKPHLLLVTTRVKKYNYVSDGAKGKLY